MHIRNTTTSGRKAWQLDNGNLNITLSVGGGHIAGLGLAAHPKLNPMWTPVWKSLEPWAYNSRKHAGKYELRLLAAILGHNVCLGYFGEPSAAEAKAGLEVHGEAPVARWSLLKKKVNNKGVTLTVGCKLPIAQMTLTRTLFSRPGSHVIRVREEVTNTSRRDLPFTMCQHVTFGPPFLEKGVTVFDMPATKGHTFPGPFSQAMRFKPDTAFTWPKAPAAKGKKAIDLRVIGKEFKHSSDFTTQLMDPRRDTAWFSALNPQLGVMVAYAWKRADYPWIGNWEENFGRSGTPWAGKSLTRGMEFTNSPFPIGLRKAVDMGKFQNTPTFRWLPARDKAVFDYSIVMMSTPEGVNGVRNIVPSDVGFDIEFTA